MRYIKLSNKICSWKWFTDGNMLKLWIYLLVNAQQFKETNYKGITIQKGQIIVGRKSLAEKLEMSEQQVRTCLNRLKSTNEITIKTTNKNSLITIVNYDKYQTNLTSINQQINQVANQQITNKQPATNQQITTSNKEREKDSNKDKNDDVLTSSKNKIKNKWLEAGYNPSDIDKAEEILKDNLNEKSFMKVMNVLTNPEIHNPLGYINTLKTKGEL